MKKELVGLVGFLFLILVGISLAQVQANITQLNYTTSLNDSSPNMLVTVNITGIQVNITNNETFNITINSWNITISSPCNNLLYESNNSANITISNGTSYLLNVSNTSSLECNQPLENGSSLNLTVEFNAFWTNSTNSTGNGTTSTNKTLSSPSLSYNYTYLNETGQINTSFNVSNAGTSSSLTVYVFNSSNNLANNTTYTNNSANWEQNWDYSFNEIGNYTIIAVTNKSGGIPGFFKIATINVIPDVGIKNVSYTVNESNVTANGLSINVTIDQVQLVNNGPVNYTGDYAGENETILVNGKPYAQTNGSSLVVNKIANLTNNSSTISQTGPGYWNITITALGLPDYNPTNNSILLESPNLTWIANWTHNISNYIIQNNTLQLNLTVTKPGSGNFILEAYLFNNSNASSPLNYTNTSQTSYLWTYTFNQTGDYTIILVADRSDGLPAWWKIPIHVREPVNITVSEASPSVNVTIKSGNDSLYSGNVSQLELILPDKDYWLNIFDEDHKVNITGTANFSNNPVFLVNRTNGSSSVIYGFNFTGITFSGDVYVWFNLTGSSIHTNNVTVYRCENFDVSKMTCSGSWGKIADENDLIDMLSSAGLVESFKIKLDSSTGYFSGYKINETSTSSSSSGSSSSNSGSSGGSSGGGGGGSSCNYNEKITDLENSYKIEVNKTTEIDFTVINAGSCTDMFVIEVTGIPDSWFELKPKTLSLEPGEDAKVNLTITPKETGNYTVKISLAGTEKSIKLEVYKPGENKGNKSESEISVNVNKIEANITTNTSIPIEVRNNLDKNITVYLAMTGEIAEIAKFPPQINLGPNEKKTVYIQIPKVNKTYSGTLQVQAGNTTLSIPVKVTPAKQKIEKASLSNLWPLILGIIVGAVIVIAIIAGIYFYLTEKEKPKGGLASLKPYYKPKKPRKKTKRKKLEKGEKKSE